MRPGLRCLLLGRVCPEVGVMEIDEHAESGGLAPFRDLYGLFRVVCAAAVGDAGLRCGRVVPDAHADAVDARIGQRDENILLFAAAVIEFDAALLQRDHRGNIRALERCAVRKRQSGYAGKGDGLRRACRRQDASAAKQQDGSRQDGKQLADFHIGTPLSLCSTVSVAAVSAVIIAQGRA